MNFNIKYIYSIRFTLPDTPQVYITHVFANNLDQALKVIAKDLQSLQYTLLDAIQTSFYNLAVPGK